MTIEVRVYLADLDEMTARPEIFSPEERLRADRFRFPDHRRRWMVGRTVLRIILARECGCEPEALLFATHPQGKPYLPAAPDLCFSLSHSGSKALYATTVRREIGVDLERIDPQRASLDVARRYFPDGEASRLARLTDAERAIEFFRLWTLWEAGAKASGAGIGVGPVDIQGFACESFVTEDGFAAAIAVSANVDLQLRLVFHPAISDRTVPADSRVRL